MHANDELSSAEHRFSVAPMVDWCEKATE